MTRRVAPLHPNATGLTAMRPVKGLARNYTEVEFTRGWAGVDHFLRQLEACGLVQDSNTEPSYAVLDVLNDEGDIIQDYNIPTAAAFRYIKRKLKLRVASTDGDTNTAAASTSNAGPTAAEIRNRLAKYGFTDEGMARQIDLIQCGVNNLDEMDEAWAEFRQTGEDHLYLKPNAEATA
jgi:hypothetical protein